MFCGFILLVRSVPKGLKKSDVDLLVALEDIPPEDYADTYFTLCEQFEMLFNRKVDLLTESSLSNPFFIQSIEKNKTLIYEK